MTVVKSLDGRSCMCGTILSSQREKVLSYTHGMDKEAFTTDTRRYDAVLRNLELIGGAATHIPKLCAKGTRTSSGSESSRLGTELLTDTWALTMTLFGTLSAQMSRACCINYALCWIQQSDRLCNTSHPASP